MDILPAPPGIDAISSVPIVVDSHFNETHLSQATGSIWRFRNSEFLVTNWHVVSGRNFQTRQVLSEQGGIPNKLIIHFPQNDRHLDPVSVEIALFDANGRPRWYHHPSKGHSVDVISIETKIPRQAQFFAVNEIKSVAIMQRVGMPLFIVGFPFGRKGYGFPVWKQGSFASEPLFSPQFDDYLMVDSASRPGMSGSVVLQRVHGMVTTEHGVGQMMNGGDGAARWVGIYSGRLLTNDKNDPQLGLVWPMQWVTQIIDGRQFDTSVEAP